MSAISIVFTFAWNGGQLVVDVIKYTVRKSFAAYAAALAPHNNKMIGRNKLPLDYSILLQRPFSSTRKLQVLEYANKIRGKQM